MKRVKILLACIALVVGILPIRARVDVLASPVQEPVEAVIQLEPLLTGLSSPLFVTNAHDGSGRLFIVEQGGRIKVLQSGAQTPTVFLDIASRVVSGGEQGLLGLTFHPQYRTNGRFFVDYTRRSDGATVIAEYHVSGGNANVADTTEIVLLTIAQPFTNHNGGMVEFGPDGYLYIGMGDGGSGNDPGNRAQNVNELLGKILRIDVDVPNGAVPYSSPAGNPFAGGIAGRDEIFAFGLRNPWRFSFDRGTGQLYVGDVGQNAREEVDVVTLGGNYGWRVFEGNRCTGNDSSLCNAANYRPPVTEYINGSAGRCSVTGGYVYRGRRSSLPVGAYVFADYCTGEIFLLEMGIQSLLLDTSVNISSFGEDEDGEIYVVALGGTIQRIVNPAAPPPPPPPTFSVQSAVVQKHKSGKVLQPITVKSNAKKFDIVVRVGIGETIPANSVVVVNGRELATTAFSESPQMLVAKLQRTMLATPGTLVVEILTPAGAHSNQITLLVTN